MHLKVALAEDILAILLPRSGPNPFMSLYRIIERVAPLREKEIREAIRDLVRRGFLEVNRGGGGWPAYYARKPLLRRI